MIEDTGHDTYQCMFDIPDVPSPSTMSKADLTEARRVEFKKSFLMRYV